MRWRRTKGLAFWIYRNNPISMQSKKGQQACGVGTWMATARNEKGKQVWEAKRRFGEKALQCSENETTVILYPVTYVKHPIIYLNTEAHVVCALTGKISKMVLPDMCILKLNKCVSLMVPTGMY